MKATGDYSSRWAMTAAAVLLLANIVVPLVWGDVYPFTSAPMFRNAPAQCCQYRVYAADGRELPAADWLLQRVYDGNPVGYGVGVCPPEVIEQEYGVVHDEAMCRRHATLQVDRQNNAQHTRVEIVQDVLGPVDNQRVGIVSSRQWTIDLRPAP